MGIPAKSKKTDLLKLPFAGWAAEKVWYSSLLIIPTRTKHETGWANVAIIGCQRDQAELVIGYPDDIQWPINRDGWDYRTDAYWPSGVLRLWSSRNEFSVDYPTSSVEILTRAKEQTK